MWAKSSNFAALMWILLAILSAVCLGFYDVSKKEALRTGDVSTVLWLSVCFSAALLLPVLLVSRFCPDALSGTLLYVPPIDARAHLLIALKAAIVLSSWYFAYVAMKHLPITLVSPMNATRPMWTLMGAVAVFGETLNRWQWAGIAVALVSFLAFSLLERGKERKMKHSRYFYALMLAVLLGSASGLYDKYLMQQLDHNAVQVWYTLYQALLWTGVVLGRRLLQGTRIDLPTTRKARLWIVGISVFLVLSDFVYLLALSYPDSLISVISTVRRSGVVIPFLYGSLVLHDSQAKAKAACLTGLLLGMALLLIGTLAG